MNILIYFENEINSQSGGTERAAENLAMYLASQQHNVFYLAKYNRGIHTLFPTYYLPTEIIETDINKKFVETLVEQKQIDCIINEGGNTADVNLFNHSAINVSSKIITCLHFTPKQAYNKYWYADIKIDGVKSIMKVIHRGLYKYRFLDYIKNNYRNAIENGDCFVVLSEYYKQEISEMLCLDDSLKRKVKVVPNFNTFNKISPLDHKENLAIFVGRVSYATKRVDRILKIWREIEKCNDDWCLEIVGDGPDLNLFKEMAEELSLKRVKFCGQQESLQYYRRAKLLFLTSNYEAMPMVIPEAMSMGCVPIIYESYGAACETIRNGMNGYLIKPFKKSEFIAKTVNLMKESKRLDAMSAESSNSLFLYDYGRIAELWSKIIYE